MLRSKVLLHIPALVASSFALAALTLPLLNADIQEKVFTNEYGNMLRESQDVVVGIAAVLALILLWLTERHKEGKKHKKKH